MNDIATQYRIITAGAGWIEKSVRGRLQFDGADRVSFLQALLTNDIAASGSGRGRVRGIPDAAGPHDHRHARVRSRAVGRSRTCPAALAATLAETFDRLIFSEDVRVSDQSSALRQISVFGGRAAECSRRRSDCLSNNCATCRRGRKSTFRQAPASWRAPMTWTKAVGTWFCRLALRTPRLPALESAGIVPASAELFEALRIDAGRPLFGVDMTTETIPLEAGLLDRAISQTKGCYVGQEVIIRVLHRGAGRVAKRLVAIDERPAGLRCAGGWLEDLCRRSGRGVVTSAAWSPRSNRVVALGYVSRDAAEPGRTVSIEGSAATMKNVVGGLQPAGPQSAG